MGFVRGGSADPVADEEAGITSLGSLFYEPLWIFYRGDLGAAVDRKTGGAARRWRSCKGLRVNVDKAGSGVPQIMEQAARAPTSWTRAICGCPIWSPTPASAALQAGLLDAIVLASAPQSPLVQRAAARPGHPADGLRPERGLFAPLRLPVARDAAARRGRPGGRPAAARRAAAGRHHLAAGARADAPCAAPAVRAERRRSLHSEAGWFNRARDFPNTRTSELPVSPEGDRAINGTPPFWQRYLPFWASNLVERMWLVLGGLLVLMLPLSRVVPPLYTVPRALARVPLVCAAARGRGTSWKPATGERDALLEELDELDRVVNKVAVPLSYADELYALRNNIYAVRKRLLARGAGRRDGREPAALQAQQLAVAAVGQQVEPAVRALPHIADAFAAIGQQALARRPPCCR